MDSDTGLSYLNMFTFISALFIAGILIYILCAYKIVNLYKKKKSGKKIGVGAIVGIVVLFLIGSLMSYLFVNMQVKTYIARLDNTTDNSVYYTSAHDMETAWIESFEYKGNKYVPLGRALADKYGDDYEGEYVFQNTVEIDDAYDEEGKGALAKAFIKDPDAFEKMQGYFDEDYNSYYIYAVPNISEDHMLYIGYEIYINENDLDAALKEYDPRTYDYYLDYEEDDKQSDFTILPKEFDTLYDRGLFLSREWEKCVDANSRSFSSLTNTRYKLPSPSKKYPFKIKSIDVDDFYDEYDPQQTVGFSKDGLMSFDFVTIDKIDGEYVQYGEIPVDGDYTKLAYFELPEGIREQLAE